MIILNEKKFVEKVLNGGEFDIDKPHIFLSAYARYLYHEKGLRMTKIIAALDEFMINHYPRYERSMWETRFDRYANNIKRYPLCECDGVHITQKEIAHIKELNNKVLEKIYFTLLCLAKFNNIKTHTDTNWVNLKTSQIFTLANVHAPNSEQEKRFYNLFKLGYIRFPKRVDDLKIIVENVDNEINDDDIIVTDYSCLGNLWLLIDGQPYIKCEKCGKIIKQTSNRQKYCRDCRE